MSLVFHLFYPVLSAQISIQHSIFFSQFRKLRKKYYAYYSLFTSNCLVFSTFKHLIHEVVTLLLEAKVSNTQISLYVLNNVLHSEKYYFLCQIIQK